jgi:hypothetical protein
MRFSASLVIGKYYHRNKFPVLDLLNRQQYRYFEGLDGVDDRFLMGSVVVGGRHPRGGRAEKFSGALGKIGEKQWHQEPLRR